MPSSWDARLWRASRAAARSRIGATIRPQALLLQRIFPLESRRIPAASWAARCARTLQLPLPLAKPGHIIGAGGLCTGKLLVRGIGLDPALVDSLEYPVTMLEEACVRDLLPVRPRDGHKGVFGKVFILGGCRDYIGAPIMASHTAVRSGAGLVFVGVPEAIYTVTAIKCMEEMPVALPERQGGVGCGGSGSGAGTSGGDAGGFDWPRPWKSPRRPAGGPDHSAGGPLSHCPGCRRHKRHRKSYRCVGQP